MLAMLIAAALLQAPQDVDARAQSLLEATGSPGAMVAMMDADGVRAGVAGVRVHGGAVAVTPDDLWHMGSNTKAMTATLAARLVEQGVIGWDSTIAEVLGALELDIHADLAGADLASLLSHRSGLAANAGMLTSMRLAGADADRGAAADRLVYARSVVSAPGGERGDFLYSNAGYVVAALMLETAAGESYEALMTREVFGPLGMTSAGWGPPGEAGAADQPRGHRGGLFGLSAAEPGAGADNPPAMNSAGRAHMSAADLMAFLDLHRRGAAGEDTGYLTTESFARLHAPVGDYALGWGVRADGALSHSGSNTMWLVSMVVHPGEGWAAAAGVNDGRLDRVSGPVRAALERD
ncbi:beta-lactamase family protein [Hyphomonadaceae bacterium ML37]|nr:beta-lactamase family protein [Hyphomonadaceae bacterium ML37]